MAGPLTASTKASATTPPVPTSTRLAHGPRFGVGPRPPPPHPRVRLRGQLRLPPAPLHPPAPPRPPSRTASPTTTPFGSSSPFPLAPHPRRLQVPQTSRPSAACKVTGGHRARGP
jgi:hypothetical protein